MVETIIIITVLSSTPMNMPSHEPVDLLSFILLSAINCSNTSEENQVRYRFFEHHVLKYAFICVKKLAVDLSSYPSHANLQKKAPP